MAAFLMSLRHVPVDEYEEVCTLLDDNGLEHYRTEPNRWGISHGALWVVDDTEVPRARELLAEYQSGRADRARAAFAEARRRGEVPSLLEGFIQSPLLRLGQWLALLVMIALSVLPFLWLSGLLG